MKRYCRRCGIPGDVMCRPCEDWAAGRREVDEDAAVALLAAVINRARLDIRTRHRTVNVGLHRTFQGQRVPILCPVGPEHRASRCALAVMLQLTEAVENGEIWTAAARMLDNDRPDPTRLRGGTGRLP